MNIAILSAVHSGMIEQFNTFLSLSMVGGGGGGGGGGIGGLRMGNRSWCMKWLDWQEQGSFDDPMDGAPSGGSWRSALFFFSFSFSSQVLLLSSSFRLRFL